MAYIEENEIGPEFIEDLLFRKEFAVLNTIQKSHYEPIWDLSQYLTDPYLSLTSYQMFTANFMNPNTPYSRLLLKWGTGSGKTIGSLAIAMKYISFLKQTDPPLGHVFILGFTESIFKNELMRFPQFGFISYEELQQMQTLRTQAMQSRSAAERYKELVSRVKRRITSGKNNGFFQFMGYKALAMQLFIPSTNSIKVSDLSREEIITQINDGRIRLNESLLKEFSNSLMICDEIHNLYNSFEKNNWGVTIETILNYNSTTRALFLSATPINNSPTEIVDILNLVLPRALFPIVQQKDLFDGEHLKPGAEKQLRSYLMGRVSFLQDVNPEVFPKRVFAGESIEGVPFLKFVRVPMSEFHYAVYAKEVLDTLPQEGHYIMDFLLPDPEIDYKGKTLAPQPGIFKTRDVQSKYEAAKSEWRAQIGLGLADDVLTGPALKLENHLGEISAKYQYMMRQVIDCLQKQKGKMFIYHNYIHMSGVLFIQEVLRVNGILMEDDPVRNDTLCVHCGRPRELHSADPGAPLKKGGGALSVTARDSEYDVYDDTSFLFTYIEIPSLKVVPLAFQSTNRAKVRAAAEKLAVDGEWVFQLMDDQVEEWKPLAASYWPDPTNEGIVFISNSPLAPSRADEIYHAMHIKPVKLQGGAAKQGQRTAGGGAKLPDHAFRAARFLIVHSNIDKKKIQHTVERFSSVSNTFGEEFFIIVGSRVLKESYTLKAVRNVIITARPDNISMLVQIMGRAVRKDAHSRLPPDQRQVEVTLLTHCLPIKKGKAYALSYEEQKYKLKMEINEEVQKINRVMHEVAIDRYFNHAKIFRDPELLKHGDLDLLPYDNLKLRQKFSPKDVKLVTFNAFHKEQEFGMVQYVIKRLFLEYSPVWKYTHLVKAVRSPPFMISMDSGLFEDYIINTALTSLIYFDDQYSFEPVLELSTRLIEKLHNTNEKLLQTIHGDPAVIIHAEDLYMLVPIAADEKLLMYQDAPYRPRIKHKRRQYDVFQYIKTRSEASFGSKRQRFVEKWKNTSIINMEPVLFEYTPKFHQTMAEEAIQYVQSILTRTQTREDPLHVFYFKLLEYYSLRGLIIWANRAHTELQKRYLGYMEPAKPMTEDEEVQLDLQTTDPHWVSSGLEQSFNKKITWVERFMRGTSKKAPAESMPIGHYFEEIPRFFHPETQWSFEGQYVLSPSSYKENDILIGFDERSKTSLNTKFKIRPPFKGEAKRDARLIEKGSVCMFKSKSQLERFMKLLKIEINPDELIADRCRKIRNRLISLERHERKRNSRIKWYYFFYEKRPESFVK